MSFSKELKENTFLKKERVHRKTASTASVNAKKSKCEAKKSRPPGAAAAPLGARLAPRRPRCAAAALRPRWAGRTMARRRHRLERDKCCFFLFRGCEMLRLERCRRMHTSCRSRKNACKICICLQRSALIQPRTSPARFGLV